MPDITVRFWAGAQRAAGHAEEALSAATVGELRETLAGRRDLTRICGVASFLVDGQQASDTTRLAAGAVVDVLPPFAGGASSTRRLTMGAASLPAVSCCACRGSGDEGLMLLVWAPWASRRG